jgi:hypothetical protein
MLESSKKLKAKIVKTKSTVIVDTATGEIQDISVLSHSILLDKTHFCLVYASFWDAVCKTNLSKSDIELFGQLINLYGDNTPFSITLPILEQCSEKSGKAVTSYRNSTRSLVKAEFILAKGSRTYVVNPIYAFQGSSNDRKKACLELMSK